ncbi:hypothetical protein P8452_57653 [Trifolium repens]|nr:hypothetical protein P8452_57653 [Trifolium repens]
MKNVSRNKFLTCFRPTVDFDSMLESESVIDPSINRRKHERQNSTSNSMFLDQNCSKLIQDQVVGHPPKQTLAKVIKAVVFQTILNTIHKKNRYSQSCFGSKRSYSLHTRSSSFKTNKEEIKKIESSLSSSSSSCSPVGCGHGLPGIYALLEEASVVHFQDFNAEVLHCLTIPNVNANVSGRSQTSPSHLTNNEAEVRFFAGDWSEIDKLLLHVGTDGKHVEGSGYDFILMAETVYSINSLQNLYNLIKKCLIHPHGTVYMAAKKYYFGVGGGSRRFLSVVEKDGVMTSNLVAEITDGSSNVREVWKLTFK